MTGWLGVIPLICYIIIWSIKEPCFKHVFGAHTGMFNPTTCTSGKMPLPTVAFKHKKVKSLECVHDWLQYGMYHWNIILHWLVVYLHLWKIWKSVGMIIPNIWKNQKCSKPPTSCTTILYKTSTISMYPLEYNMILQNRQHQQPSIHACDRQ